MRSAIAGLPVKFTHSASHQAGLLIRNLLFRSRAVNNDDVPRVTFTDPELAHVGLTEVQARERRIRSACCAGPIMTTTAPRPSAKPAANQGGDQRKV